MYEVDLMFFLGDPGQRRQFRQLTRTPTYLDRFRTPPVKDRHSGTHSAKYRGLDSEEWVVYDDSYSTYMPP